MAGLLAASACTLTAQRMLLIAVPWLVLTQTGSVADTGLASGAQVATMLLAKLFAGPLIDRAGATRIWRGGDLACAAALASLATTGTPRVWLIVTAMAVVGAAQGPSVVAKTVLLAGLASTARRSTPWATGLMSTVERAATTAGPLAAGLMITELDPQYVLWLVAALFTAASLLARTSVVSSRRADGGRSYWSELRCGAAFLVRDRSLSALALMYAITNWLDEALLVTLLPLWARTGGHSPAWIGATISIAGATAIGTALTYAYLGHRMPRRLVYLLAAVISGPTRFAVVAVGLPPAAVLAVFAISGVGSGLLSPLADAVQLERIPADLRGRVLALIRAAAWIGIPAGGITGAALATLTGLPAALWLSAATYLTAVVYPGWRVAWTAPSTHTLTPATGGV